MLKQKWLWFAVILLLIISIPGLANRWKVETSSTNYEIIIPYSEIVYVADNSDLTVDDVLSTLKEAGLTTVSLEAASLEDMEKQGTISVYEEHELASLLRFTPYIDEFDVEKLGLYISVPKESETQQFLKETIQPEEVEIGGEQFYFLPKDNGHYLIDTPIGYNQSSIEKINKHGLFHVFRAKNSEEYVNENIVDQLVTLKNDRVSGILGSGTETIGFGHSNQDDLIKKLQDAGYYYYSIEGNILKGEETFARSTKFDIIRLLSIDVNKETSLTVSDSIDRTIRALKERNIKSIFYHIRTKGVAEDNLNEATEFLKGVQEKMPSSFTAGAPKLFDRISIPAWVTGVILLAGILYTFLVSELLKSNILRILMTGLMALLAIAYFALDRILFLQVFALIIACITPIYAVVKASNGSTRISNIFLQYAKAVGISLIGIAIVIGLLNGNGFITGYDVFKGVKLVYVIPILGIVLFVFFAWTNIASGGMKNGLNQTVTLLNKEVKYWHLVLFVIAAGIGLFYISRTGNTGPVSNLELTFRQLQEDILYVRPRTKEFLIGFPFFVLALYVMGKNRKWGMIFLIPGVIGFLSIVNTFTHLHIPIGISLLRTLYSVVLGFVIGLVFILIYKIVCKFISKAKAKWTSSL
ncbi:DUF5693 family protein [Ureibacillus sp. MALMAid1270]|uniref:DUF5693 family protein n=1 Tax=Ureibacillus sp. MALMAid1270 TaxID=3411629 RepID=UPI003BA439C4